jgi:hypothetical protein
MELKDGIIIERKGEDGNFFETTLKEFEVLPLTASVVIKSVSGANGDSVKMESLAFCARIKIKDLPPNAWNETVLGQMSVADWAIMQKAIEEHDENFTFAPPKIRV